MSGRLDLSDPNRKVGWNSGHHSFGTKFPRPPRRLKTAEEAQEWNNSHEVKEARKNNRYYGLRIAEDGSFRLENVLLRSTEGLPEINIETSGYYPKTYRIDVNGAEIEPATKIIKLKQEIDLKRIPENPILRYKP